MDAIKEIETALAAGPSEGQWIADNNEGFGAWRVWAGMTPSGHGKPGPLLFQIVGDSAETDANAAYLVATQPANIRDVLQLIAARDAEIERLRAMLTKTTACISDGDSSDYARSARREAKRYLAALNPTQGAK